MCKLNTENALIICAVEEILRKVIINKIILIRFAFSVQISVAEDYFCVQIPETSFTIPFINAVIFC